MKEDQEALNALDRAKVKLKIAITKYPIEVFDISCIIKHSEKHTSEEINWAFTRLHEILKEIDNSL